MKYNNVYDDLDYWDSIITSSFDDEEDSTSCEDEDVIGDEVDDNFDGDDFDLFGDDDTGYKNPNYSSTKRILDGLDIRYVEKYIRNKKLENLDRNNVT